jgi:hypothetical protein
MAMVVSGGEVGPGDIVEAELPAGNPKPLRHI